MTEGEGIPAAWPMLGLTGAAIELPVAINKTVTMVSETESCDKPVRTKIKSHYIREKNFHGKFIS